jgi:hypothetical protein
MLRFDKVGFTHDEFLTMFAPPEHHEMLKEVRKIAHVSSSTSYLTTVLKDGVNANKVDVEFTLHGNDAPLVPMGKKILKTTPGHLVERLTTRVNHVIGIRKQFSIAIALMDWLDNNCDTLAQIRFIWPSILTLLTATEDYHVAQQQADRVRVFKPQRIPALPMEVREACKLTSGIITSASLLSKDDPSPFKAPVTIHVSSIDAPDTAWGPLGMISA